MEVFVKVKVWGDLACFTRPEMKVERYSYNVMTPSAARGILDSIYWKPEFVWVINDISVLNPINTIALKRNEVQSKISPTKIKRWMKDFSKYTPQNSTSGTGDVTQRQTIALKDVAYIIHAKPYVFHPTESNTEIKHMAIFNDRVNKGQCFRSPFLGCKEFPAFFEKPNGTEKPIEQTCDLGYMLYDIIHGENAKQTFFNAKLTNGVMNTRPEQVLPNIKNLEEAISCLYKV